MIAAVTPTLKDRIAPKLGIVIIDSHRSSTSLVRPSLSEPKIKQALLGKTNLYASKSKQHIKIKPIVYKNAPFSSDGNSVLKLNYEQK